MRGLADIRTKLSGRVRLIIAANVLVLAALFTAYTLNPLYDVLKRVGLVDAVSWCIYALLFASTLFASWLCLGDVFTKIRGGATGQRSGKAIALDGALLLVWCLVLAGICFYGFMLGLMGL